MSALQLVSSNKSFNGEQRVYQHHSESLGCDMKFGVYLPSVALNDKSACPVLYFLSGLCCTHENFIQKSGMQAYAAKHGIIVVNPDTSPRNVEIPGQDDADDFGSGAGFYVDATEAPWSKHYKMYTYVTKELIEVINANLPVLPNKQSICGHSMGGHGALICALKNPGLYTSVSAFAPICNPIQCAWGKKAFSGYLGTEATDEWKQWDACSLAENYQGKRTIGLFIDQGSADGFLKQGQLLPENLVNAAKNNDYVQTIYQEREGYDHSYFYIASFISEHFDYHANLLKS